MSEQQLKHVFISYVRENSKQVDRLCQELEQHGVNIWLDRTKIKPGARWKEAIRDAINEGAFFMACFSREYRSKPETHMNEELTLAIERLRKIQTDREWFIPVLLSECDVPARSIGGGETLQDINWVPLNEDWDSGIQRILSVIKPIPPEVQALINAMASKDENIRINALVELIKVDDSRITQTLITALNDSNKIVKLKAAEALCKIRVSSIPKIVNTLKYGYEFFPVKLPNDYDDIGYKTVTVLIDALKDEDSNIHKSAAKTLKNINTPDAQKALEEYKQKAN